MTLIQRSCQNVLPTLGRYICPLGRVKRIDSSLLYVVSVLHCLEIRKITKIGSYFVTAEMVVFVELVEFIECCVHQVFAPVLKST